jgi:Tol biopolymer transport system component
MKKYLLLFLIPFVFASCVPKVAFHLTSVPEEGGISFTKLTHEDEKIVHPVINKVAINGKKMLIWYAAPLLAISPDGKQLSYLALNNDFHNLYIRNVRGGRAKVQRTFNRHIHDMSFSPDGKYIAFTDGDLNDWNINMINATEGAAITQLAASTENELGPIFSPDGGTVFYTVNQGSRYYVWSVNVETGLKTQHSEGFTPVITPDGENLLITRNNKDTEYGEIWMINLKKGTETLILSDTEKGFSSPSISPDGKTIACVGVTLKQKNRRQNLDIYTFKTDGTQLTQLTFHAGHDTSPIWAPDGKYLYFLGQRGNKKGEYNIWKMTVR